VAARSRGEHNPVWAIVGVLSKEGSIYEFRYTQGAHKLPGLAPFPGLPDLDTVYQMEDLFPIFKNRLLSVRRPEYKKWLSWGGFDNGDTPDAIAVLSTLGSRRTADSLELFAPPIKLSNGNCHAQFFLHGVRHHVTPEILAQLTTGEKLVVRSEDDNPHDHLAVAVDDSTQHCLGYVPKFFTADIRYLMEHCPDQLEVSIKRANVDAPSHYQVLCQLKSCWPAGFEPCIGGDFQRITDRDAAMATNQSKEAL